MPQKWHLLQRGDPARLSGSAERERASAARDQREHLGEQNNQLPGSLLYLHLMVGSESLLTPQKPDLVEEYKAALLRFQVLLCD